MARDSTTRKQGCSLTTPIAQYLGTNDLSVIPEHIDAMTPEQMRAALHRINKLISIPACSPPPDGCLVIAAWDQPRLVEHAYVRQDDGLSGRGDSGTWWGLGDSTHSSWNEVIADDATIDGHYVHDSLLAVAILGRSS